MAPDYDSNHMTREHNMTVASGRSVGSGLGSAALPDVTEKKKAMQRFVGYLS